MELRNVQNGFSTIELMIAFAIIVLALTGVIVVVFGNQAITLDAELNNLALYKAEGGLENSFAAASEGFDQISDDDDIDGIFTLETRIEDLGCFKIASSSVLWQLSTENDQDLSLTSIFASPAEFRARAGNCFTQPPEDDWENPGTFAGVGLGGHGATEIDVFEEFVYLVANKFPPLAGIDLYIMKFDPEAVLPADRLTDRGQINIEEGINDIYVAGIAGGRYAFVASASTTAQLQVIDVSDEWNPIWDYDARRKLPGVDPLPPLGTGSYPQGFSIYYYDKHVYIGTKETEGPEFHIFNVLNPTDPVHEASIELTHNVNDIYVQGDWAYLATSDNNHELMVININPAHPDYMTHPDITGYGFNVETDLGFDADDGTNDATSVYVSGDSVFLSRKQHGGVSKLARDFFILNKDSVLDGASETDGILSGIDLGIQKGAYGTGIRTLGRFLFIGLDDSNVGLQIFNISDPTKPTPPSPCAGLNFSENSSGIDAWVYEISGDDVGYVFTSNISMDEIQVFYDQPGSC